MRGALRAGAALALLVGAALIVAATASAGTGPQRVHPGGAVTVDVRGFAPDATVALQLAGHAGQRSVRADAGGRVRTTYRAPRTAGTYRLLVAGLVRDRPAPPVRPGPTNATRAPAPIDAVVPRVVGLPFDVLASTGSAGATTGGSSTTTAASGSSGGVAGAGSGRTDARGVPGASGHGGLSVTGGDLAALVAAALLAVAGGGLLVRTGRARRRRAH